MPFDKDVWELYDMRTDFGQATDLAAKNPEKLKELQALFDREARKYNVYPMADNIDELLTAERPRLVSGNKASYGPGTVRLAGGRGHRHQEPVVLPRRRGRKPGRQRRRHARHPRRGNGRLRAPGAEGQADLPSTTSSVWSGTRSASSEPLPKGKCTIRFDFAYDGGGMGKGGTGTLSVNGKKVGEGRIEKTVPIIFSTDDTFDVGEDWGTPVSPTYELPFKFTGILKRVTVEAEDLAFSPLSRRTNFRGMRRFDSLI